MAADGSVTTYEGAGMLEGSYPEIAPGESHSASSVTALPTEYGTMHGSYTLVVMERIMDLWVMGAEKLQVRCERCGLSLNGRPVHIRR
jgi:hypothetical protein